MENVENDKEPLNCRVVDNSVLGNCRCNEFQERSERAERRCAELLLELQKKKSDYEELEVKLKPLEVEKFSIEELALKISSEGLGEKSFLSCGKEKGMSTVVDLTEVNEEDDKVTQLMIENSVLEHEKKMAEREVEFLKEKCKKLELLMGLRLAGFDCNEEKRQKQTSEGMKPEADSHLGTSLEFHLNQDRVANLVNVVSSSISPIKEIGDMQSAGFVAGTPPSYMDQTSRCLDSKLKPCRKIRKQLAFETEGTSCKKMVPSTSFGAKSASDNFINIVDSDDETNVTHLPITDAQEGGSVSEKEKISHNILEGNSYVQDSKEDLHFGEDALFVATPKRKRTSNVITSDSENEDDVLSSKAMRMHIQEANLDHDRYSLNRYSASATSPVEDKVAGIATPKRRLRKCSRRYQEDKRYNNRSHKGKYDESTPTNEDADDNDSEKVLSDSEDESLKDFIVDDSYVSDCEDACCKSEDVPDGDVNSDSSESQDASDEDIDFNQILSTISRKKGCKGWEFEGDMLAAFGKDPSLCMKAVCAIYRQQTSEEQTSKGTFYHNQRGFNKIDALRGSELAEFLTDGDPYSDIKRSVLELQGHDPKAVELCRTLAVKYSKQLFEIYKNKKDPYFP